MITVMTTMMIEVKTTMMITVMISMMITLIIILMMIRPRRCMQALQKLQHYRHCKSLSIGFAGVAKTSTL